MDAKFRHARHPYGAEIDPRHSEGEEGEKQSETGDEGKKNGVSFARISGTRIETSRGSPGATNRNSRRSSEKGKREGSKRTIKEEKKKGGGVQHEDFPGGHPS
jgi:hypothetical protein